MGTAIASLTGYGRPASPPSQTGQVPTYNPDFTFEAFATAGDIQSTGLPGGQTIVGGTVNGDNLTLTPSSAGGGDIVVTGGGVVIENNEPLQWVNNSGNRRPIIRLDSNNHVVFNSVDLGGIYRFDSGASTILEVRQGRVIFPPGSTANPSLQFTHATTYGIYSAASNEIGVVIFGDEEYRFTSAGFSVGEFTCGQNLVSWGDTIGDSDVGIARAGNGILRVTNANSGGGSPQNAPMRQFDARLFNSTTTNRPAAGNAGRVIYDSDLAKLILDNGTDWVNVDGTAL